MSCSECNETASVVTPSADYKLDCFMVKKVYDWVKRKTEQNAIVTVPDEFLKVIQDAIDAGDIIDTSATVVLSEITTKVALIDRKNASCACVQFRKLIPLHVSIYDETTKTMLAVFDKTVLMFDTASLCFPTGMPDDAIQVKVTEVSVDSLSTNPEDGNIAFLLALCQNITVTLDVIASIPMAGYCPSRAGSSCTGSVTCATGTPSYPTQCSSPSTCG